MEAKLQSFGVALCAWLPQGCHKPKGVKYANESQLWMLSRQRSIGHNRYSDQDPEGDMQLHGQQLRCSNQLCEDSAIFWTFCELPSDATKSISLLAIKSLRNRLHKSGSGHRNWLPLPSGCGGSWMHLDASGCNEQASPPRLRWLVWQFQATLGGKKDNAMWHGHEKANRVRTRTQRNQAHAGWQVYSYLSLHQPRYKKIPSRKHPHGSKWNVPGRLGKHVDHRLCRSAHLARYAMCKQAMHVS